MRRDSIYGTFRDRGVFGPMATCMRTWILIIFCAITAIGCGGSAGSPEESLRAWVDEVELAAEEKDRGAILNRISDNYADSRGNGREDIGDRLVIYFLRQQSIVIVSNIDEIEVIGESVANMSLTVAMAGSNSGTFGLSADAYRFDLELERPDDEWMLIGARWGQVGKALK